MTQVGGHSAEDGGKKEVVDISQIRASKHAAGIKVRVKITMRPLVFRHVDDNRGKVDIDIL